MREAEAAYLAGFLDADGCISVCGDVYPQVQVAFTNTEREVIEWILGRLGGNFNIAPPGRGGKKPCYVLVLYGMPARKALLALVPYLRIKRVQAEIALLMLANKPAPSRDALQKWCRAIIHGLNKNLVQVM